MPQVRLFELGILLVSFAGCSAEESPQGDAAGASATPSAGAGGTSGISAGSGGSGTAGARAGTGGNAGSTTTTGGSGGSAGVSATSGAGLGGTTAGSAGSSPGGAGAGGASGSAGAGGANAGGDGGSDTGMSGLGGSGPAGSGGAASGGLGGQAGTSDNGGTGGSSTGAPRSMGYVGCSMSVNVTQGYQALGAERLWPPVQAYNGKVVQNWTNANDSAWQSFDQQADMYGTPTAVWVMICIFSNMVTYDETKQIIANVRERAPGATLYITGQPLYAQGLSCDLAGSGGPEKTDMMAQMAAEDGTQNVIYGGTFGPLSSAQRADSCHANTEGQRALGQQAIDKWGE